MALSAELQCLLQSFFSQNAFTETNLRALIAELLHDGARDLVDRETINETITAVNDDLADLDFEIRRTIQQADGTDIWVLCNTTSDALTQLATLHSANEVAYFKVLLDDIFVKNNTRRREVLAIAGIDAVRAASSVSGMTKAQAETALRQFVDEAWLEKSARGWYGLTARSLMELQGYLRDTYDDNDDGVETIKTCFACKEFLTMGYRCPDLNCTCRLHLKCSDAFFSTSRKCPVCKVAVWDKQALVHVGERAATASVAQNGDLEASENDGRHETDEQEPE